VGLPIRLGDGGEAVRDLQLRLTAAGFAVEGDELAIFGPATERAVRAFQAARGLRVDGSCGQQTWSALVEAGYHLGDRLLYHRTPPLRGDDVATLQRRLGALGFDAGRVDGIFGVRTAGALVDFQRNAGLTTDGICGPATLDGLARLGAKAGTAGVAVAQLRERETRRSAPRTLSGRRIVVGSAGGVFALVDAVARVLVHAGAHALPVDDPDDAHQSAQANAFGADLYLGLTVVDDGCAAAYYGTGGFTSTGGRHLASLLCRELPAVLGHDRCDVRAMALPVLRETRMPAVVCEVGPPARVVERTAEVARAVTRAIGSWVEAPDEVEVDPQP
jgi:N-acetylmuramoyl-L-alanine amidase